MLSSITLSVGRDSFRCTLRKHSTPMGFDPTRAEHIGLAGRRLNHSATVSSKMQQSESASLWSLQMPVAILCVIKVDSGGV